jgi:predicted RNase H-like nuclease (RuvC/YqgF family)
MNNKKPNKSVTKRDKDALIKKNPELKALLDESELIQKSIEWWDNNVSELVNELDRLEELPWSFEIEEEIEFYQRRLRNLLKRGQVEKKNVANLEMKLNGYLFSLALN